MKTKTIGKVKISYSDEQVNDVETKKEIGVMRNSYLDNSEEYLKDLFSNPESKIKAKINEIISDNIPFEIFYHLSPQRRMILDWYNFKKDASVLEIGAGCGAITGLFFDKVKTIDAIELTKSRAEIIAHRFSDRDELQVYSGNLSDFNLKKKYDYITLIGVLEYAGTTIDNGKLSYTEPFSSLIETTSRYLKEGGHLLIAIENKLGIKYLSGAHDDHHTLQGDYFMSIEDYLRYTGIRTFSKVELNDLILKNGYKSVEFYYPFPDYKFPLNIMSDKSLHEFNMPTSFYVRSEGFSSSQSNFFNDLIFARNLVRENIMDRFANSFLIDAVL